MTIVGKRIAARRKELDMTQAQLAKKVGIGKSSINRYENDTGDLPLSRAQAIADALECRLSDLMADAAETGGYRRDTDPLTVSLQVPIENMCCEDKVKVAEYIEFLQTRHAWEQNKDRGPVITRIERGAPAVITKIS